MKRISLVLLLVFLLFVLGACKPNMSEENDDAVDDDDNVDDECEISGETYEEGETNPLNPCLICDPSQTRTSWSYSPSTTTCRAAADDCDVAEYCTGANDSCPDDQFAQDGADCDDEVFCNGTDTCVSGACTEHYGDPCRR